MKRQILTLAIILAITSTCWSQPKAASTPEKLIEMAGRFLMRPTWSPDGHQIAFTADKNNGIWISEATGTKIRQLTSDQNSGFGFSWSADSKTILARPVEEVNAIRYNLVKLYDVETGKVTQLMEPNRSLRRLPVWTGDDTQVAVIINDELIKLETGKPRLKSADANISKAAIFGGELISSDRVSTQSVSLSQFDGHYIYNPAISPDGNKVVFQVSGLGLYVSNLDGTELKHLGFSEQASWMPDNEFVVATTVKDDGEVVTQAELTVININSGASYSLLPERQTIALNPSVSPDGKKLVFNNPEDGAIYQVQLQ